MNNIRLPLNGAELYAAVQAAVPAAPPKTPLERAMERLLADKRRIQERSLQLITFTEPILYRNDENVIFPRTLTVIQGKFGRHKSRLTEAICAALLKKPTFEAANNHIGFRANPTRKYALLYCDTERNLYEQLPFAIQQIRVAAGYAPDEEPVNFDYCSLLSIERENRFAAFESYLEAVRKRFHDAHLFVVIDVVTDVISDFNNVRESMKLVDLVNCLINDYDCSVLAVIHENPSSTGESKARGHVGTELVNKASTVIALDFVRDSADAETPTVCVRYVKTRNSKRYEPFYVEYAERLGALVEVEKPMGAKEVREQEKRALVASIFKGVRMTRKRFAQDYAAIKGFSPDSRSGFNIFREAEERNWIVKAAEKSADGEELFWFVDDAPEDVLQNMDDDFKPPF